MIYKGLEYDLDENEFVIFDNQSKALEYDGDKKVLLDEDLYLRTENYKSLNNIYEVSGFVSIAESSISSLGKLRHCKYIWLNKKQVEMFKEKIDVLREHYWYKSFLCYLKGDDEYDIHI